ncbi:TlpA family protein disulfide reductase [Tepidimonas charontis]|uniref:TlpA family protein disulfide reductase n=1 Tax=Tepidimonas charontis TaxID=2267262 RepID=UPI001F2F75D0|nr:TlpA disulfide reductase family protein [Tepidimonas charontis]
MLGGTAPRVGWTQSASSAEAEAKAGPLPVIGQPWSVPPMTRLEGVAFEPAQADGRVLVLYWWASTCPFCAVTTPHIERLWRTHGARGDWLLLGLSIDRTEEAARRYLAQRGYTFPSAWVTPQVQRAMPKPKGLPITLVRGRDGRIAMAERGQLFPEDVEAIARFF